MRKYWTIYKVSIFESVNRRGEMLVYILEDFIGPLLSILLWIGAIHYSGSIQAGWSVERIVTYFLITTLLTIAVNHYVDTRVGYEEIAQGDIANTLIKPLSYHAYIFSTETGWKTVRLFLALIPFGFFLLLFQKFINFHFSAYQIAATLLFSLFAYVLIFLFKFLIGMSAFWITENNGLVHASWALQAVFAGRLIPFDFLPASLQHMSLWLPYRFFFYVPANALLSQLSYETLGREIGIGLLWILLLGVANVWMLRVGLKRFTDIK